jgi:uncharacterized protein DUF4012
MRKIKLKYILKIFTIFLLLIFFSYFFALAFLTYSLYQSYKNQDLNNLIQKSQYLTKLTKFSQNSNFILARPFKIIHHTSETIYLMTNFSSNVKSAFQAVVSNDTDTFHSLWVQIDSQLPTLLDNLSYLSDQTDKSPRLKKLFEQNDKFQQFQSYLTQLEQNRQLILQLKDLLPNFLAINKRKHYTVLLQNNMELRPTGGFMGSYAQVYFQNTGLTQTIVEDIYVPDGQITGHVNPPDPIQQAFKQGWWRLRDSNWDPDFSVSAKSISWFFDKGDVDIGSGLIAINLNVIEDILSEVGSVALSDYDRDISSQNLYSTAQYESERDFFPGSTQKKDFLSSLTNGLLLSLEDLSFDQILNLSQILSKHLEQNDIQFYFSDVTLQEFINSNNWSGNIYWPKNESATNDYFFLVEANLSANKANCCVTREIGRKITNLENNYEVITQINYENLSPVSKPKPPKYWGGDYENYLRLILPSVAQIKSISINDKVLADEEISQTPRDLNLVDYGFFANVDAGEKITIELTYLLPRTSDSYQLFVQKQSGLPETAYTFDYIQNAETVVTKKLINSDQIIKFE